MSGPSDLVRAFVTALAVDDSEALEALCTEGGWSHKGDSVGRFVRQAARSKLTFLPLGELIEADRRAAICGLLSGRESGRQHGRLWLHAVNDGRWLLEGMCKSDKTAALFVSGVLPAIFDPMALPESPSAQRWADALLSDALERPDTLPAHHGDLVVRGLETLAYDTEGELVVVGTRTIDAIGRHVAGFGRRHGPDDLRQCVWFALEQDGQTDDFQVVGHGLGAGSALMIEPAAG